MDFNDKVVWITGGSSGIGESLARALYQRGARLILSSNEDAELERAQKELGDPNRARILHLDLSQVDGLAETSQKALAMFGRVDILVNNGGISQRSLARDTSIATYRRLLDIDFLGHVALTLAVLPGMIERKEGLIVVTSSVAGKIGAPLRTGYCAAKHALHGFFDTLRAEEWENNIRVLIVCPTAVKTGISMRSVTGSGEAYGKMSDHLEAGITPDQAAAAMIRAMEKGREEIVVGFDKLKLAVYIKRFWPGLFSRLLRKAEIN